jgi:hypothetical protein
MRLLWLSLCRAHRARLRFLERPEKGRAQASIPEEQLAHSAEHSFPVPDLRPRDSSSPLDLPASVATSAGCPLAVRLRLEAEVAAVVGRRNSAQER